MNNRIINLLGETNCSITKVLKELETINGCPSHDVRFYADTHHQVRKKIAQLSLDADDTTGEELYHALLVKFDEDARLFEKRYGNLNDFNARASKAADIILTCTTMPQYWALRNLAARKILKDHPPKQMMKILGYRSVDSMLKRENVAKVFLTAKNTESANWHNILNRTISKLDQTSFELRQLKIVILPQAELTEIYSDSNIVVADELAAVGLWPTDENSKAPLLSMVLTLNETINNLSHQNENNLNRLGDSVRWWADMSHLLTELDGEKVSFNIHDVAESHLRAYSYLNRVIDRSRYHYWQNLLKRYDKHPKIEAVFDNSAFQKVRRLKFKAPEPSYEFEYVEDI